MLRNKLPSADLGPSIPERGNSREGTKDLRWKQAVSVQTTERTPKWREHSEQGERERGVVEKAKVTSQPRLSIIKEKDNSGPKYSQMRCQAIR